MEDLSEKEQLDAIRAWWTENGSYVIGGIVVGIVVIFGWNRWQTSVADTEIAASTLFEGIMEAAELNLVDNAELPAETLFSEYSDSPYAAQARLAMTRLYMDTGRDQDAADVLRPLAEMPLTDELALVGRFRMTQILLYQEKPQEVVDLVEGLPESGFSTRFSESLGDAYVMLERYADAEAAYMAASNDDPLAPTVDITKLQLKINDLPSADQIATEAAEAAATEEDAVE
ncbi:MAG: tetratricopeptide repeat protein, partial [Woeseiaceae bacterium]|nr:tetratricopeptide repeat protein [Woeseiaceae bacterium]